MGISYTHRPFVLCILFICPFVFSAFWSYKVLLVKDQTCKDEKFSVLQNLKVQSIIAKLFEMNFYRLERLVEKKKKKES